MGCPSNLNLIWRIDRPWGRKGAFYWDYTCSKYEEQQQPAPQPPGEMAVWRQQHTCLSQYAFMSLLSAVCLLILNWTTEPSWPATFRLMWSFSVFTPSCNNKPPSINLQHPRRQKPAAKSRTLECPVTRHGFSWFNRGSFCTIDAEPPAAVAPVPGHRPTIETLNRANCLPLVSSHLHLKTGLKDVFIYYGKPRSTAPHTGSPNGQPLR